MQAYVWAAILICGGGATPDGSLLFLENSNRFVELYTGSGTTHVALVLNEGNRPYVYEATPGAVRKLPLEDYYAELGRLNQRRGAERKIRVWLVRPGAPYSDAQVAAMRACLDQELGRRYSIKGYVRGDSDGLHCAELAARALCAAEALRIERCQAESPASLLEKIEPHSAPKAVLRIEEPDAARSSWSDAARRDWSLFGDWCRWSCWETWTWCW